MNVSKTSMILYFFSLKYGEREGLKGSEHDQKKKENLFINNLTQYQ